jgi:uncharacterized caspase-like protein
MFLLTGLASAEPERRVALVIGESRYVHVAGLDNTARDARLVADTLKSIGFDLIGGKAQTDLSKANFEEVIKSFRGELSTAQVGLFYYAGHGFEMDGINYLVPIDANPSQRADADFELIDASLILRQMDAAGARLNIILLDACRSNPFSGRGLRDVSGGLAEMQAPRGTLISYATEPGKVAQDGNPGKDSPYALALAQSLVKPGHDVFQVFNDVGVIVDRMTDGLQRPWVTSSPIEGEFYFVSAPPQSPPAPPAPTAPAPAADSSAVEVAFWESVRDSNDSAVLGTYLQRYPNGAFASLAQARMAALAAPPAAPSVPRGAASFDGTWRGVFACGPDSASGGYAISIMPITIKGGELSASRTGASIYQGTQNLVKESFQGRVEPDGKVTITGQGETTRAGSFGARFDGTIRDGILETRGINGDRNCTMSYRRDANSDSLGSAAPQ